MDSWDSGLLANVSKLREFVAENDVKEVTVFSFAVWDDKDVATFNKLHKQMLEDAFNVKVVECLSMEDVRKVVCQWAGVHFDLHDFVALWGKRKGFMDYCSATLRDCTAVLVDDVVPNQTLWDHDSNLRVELVHMKKGKPLRKVVDPK